MANRSIVTIGASAGGIETISKIITIFPKDIPRFDFGRVDRMYENWKKEAEESKASAQHIRDLLLSSVIIKPNRRGSKRLKK